MPPPSQQGPGTVRVSDNLRRPSRIGRTRARRLCAISVHPQQPHDARKAHPKSQEHFTIDDNGRSDEATYQVLQLLHMLGVLRDILLLVVDAVLCEEPLRCMAVASSRLRVDHDLTLVAPLRRTVQHAHFLHCFSRFLARRRRWPNASSPPRSAERGAGRMPSWLYACASKRPTISSMISNAACGRPRQRAFPDRWSRWSLWGPNQPAITSAICQGSSTYTPTPCLST